MLCINNPSTDPYFNMAVEEYLIKEYSEDVFMLWRNSPAIIVGKHQNSLAEINIDFVKQHHIKVVRRLSGGGTVFHDLGNLNYTFIMTGESNHLVDFHKYTAPVLEVLLKLGLNAVYDGRNNLSINGLKFSGNAEHVYKNRVLHHGTLLFSSGLTDLSAALNVKSFRFSDKAVKSVRSHVTNISEHLEQKMDVLQFRDAIMSHIIERYPDATHYELNVADIQKINELVASKYSTWKWNFGYSPKYKLQGYINTGSGEIVFDLDVKDGLITDVKISGDFLNTKDIEDVELILEGCKHEEIAISERLKGINFSGYFKDIELNEFVKGMF